MKVSRTEFYRNRARNGGHKDKNISGTLDKLPLPLHRFNETHVCSTPFSEDLIYPSLLNWGQKWWALGQENIGNPRYATHSTAPI
jgi:hypothetical protein